MILKEGAARGCSPRTLGSILAREGLGKSHVEKMHHLVLQLACAEQVQPPAATLGNLQQLV